MASPTPAQSSPATRFVGLILISIGVLWLVLTGLCTLVGLTSLVGEGGSLEDSILIFSFAVPSAILGAGVYFIGRLLRPRA